MRVIILRNGDLRELRVWVNWTSPWQQVQVPIRWVITPIWGHLNPISQVILMISHRRLYPTYYSHLCPPSLTVLSTTPPSLQEHNNKSSLSFFPRYHHELTLGTSYTECSIHWIQHIPSTAYTYYSIPRVQHTPSTAYISHCLLSLHSHNFELTAECDLSFGCTSLPFDRHQPVHHKCFTGNFTCSHFLRMMLTIRWIECQHLAQLPSTASWSTTSKYSSNLTRS